MRVFSLFFVLFICVISAKAQLTFTVTRSDDRNQPTCAAGDCSLREAVDAAKATAGNDTIDFASGLTKITLTNEIPINTINGTLVISGNGANVLTIDGGAGTNRIFFIVNSIVNISGLTLTGGNGTGTIASGDGGAIIASNGSLTLDSVHVTGNTAASQGGGVSFRNGTPRIINSTFSNNTAKFCAGFETQNNVRLTVVNSTFSGNTATSNGGGGFCNIYGTITLRNVTITDNITANGGGIVQSSGTLSTLTLGNTIVAGNIATSGSGPEIEFQGGTITSEGGNLVGDSPGDSTNTGPNAITYQPTDNRDVNPMLGALQNNGGTTPTHGLLIGSLAIDAGLNALASDPSVGNATLTNDQRGIGFPRVLDGNSDGTATVDIGAFELDTSAPTTPIPTPNGLFTNSTSIVINDFSTAPAPANPYPSNIIVSGLNGTVTDINVRLNGLSHTYLSDIAILLVAPDTNRRFVLLSDCVDKEVSNITVTFDDQASRLVPCNGVTIPSGSFRPTNQPFSYGGTLDSTDQFPQPAPQPESSYSKPAPTGNATLNNTFGGTNPNGVWSLYIVDKVAGDMGVISGGYSLIITTTAAPTAAAVSVSGRAVTPNGRGIANIIITMTDSEGNVRTTMTNSFGYYKFQDVMAGATYIFTARGKRYKFSQPSQVMNINDETNNINFIGYSNRN